jgi:hypothetical protein
MDAILKPHKFSRVRYWNFPSIKLQFSLHCYFMACANFPKLLQLRKTSIKKALPLQNIWYLVSIWYFDIWWFPIQ